MSEKAGGEMHINPTTHEGEGGFSNCQFNTGLCEVPWLEASSRNRMQVSACTRVKVST